MLFYFDKLWELGGGCNHDSLGVLTAEGLDFWVWRSLAYVGPGLQDTGVLEGVPPDPSLLSELREATSEAPVGGLRSEKASPAGVINANHVCRGRGYGSSRPTFHSLSLSLWPQAPLRSCCPVSSDSASEDCPPFGPTIPSASSFSYPP